MKFKITGNYFGDWQNIIHLGADNGVRQPGIWFYANTFNFHIKINGEGNELNQASNLQLGDVVDLKVICYYEGTSQKHSVFVNEELIFTDHSSLILTTETVLPVYLSDPWYSAANIDWIEAYYRALPYDSVKQIAPNAYPYNNERVQIAQNYKMRRIWQYPEYDLSFKIKINGLGVDPSNWRNILQIAHDDSDSHRWPAIYFWAGEGFNIGIWNSGPDASGDTNSAPTYHQIITNFAVGELHKIRVVCFHDYKLHSTGGKILFFIDDELVQAGAL